MPTQTASDRLARELSDALEALAARIPNLQSPGPKSRSIRGHRTVPRQFLRSMIAVVDGSESLQAVRKFDPAEARDALQFEAAFVPLLRQLVALTASLSFTIDARIAAVVAKALQTYTIAKAIARDPSSADLTNPLRVLKRDLGRKGPKPKAK